MVTPPEPRETVEVTWGELYLVGALGWACGTLWTLGLVLLWG